MQIKQASVSLWTCCALTIAALAGAANAQESVGASNAQERADAANAPQWAGAASAQQFERNNQVTNRERPGLDAEGVPVGGWSLYPQLGVETLYTDNVFADDQSKKDDVAGLILPSMRLYSRTESYQADVGASAEVARYADYSSENYEDSQLWANGQTKAGSVGSVDAEVSRSDLHQLRTDPADVLGSDLTKYSRTSMYLAYTHDPGSLFARVGGHVVILNYDNTQTPTGTLNNNDRDETIADIGVRVGYQVARDYLAYAEVLYDDWKFDQKFDNNGFERSSHGGEARLGVQLDPTAVISGDVYVGYLKQKYDDFRFSDSTGPSYGGDLAWNVSRLTTITLIGDRSVATTTVSGSSGILTTSVGVAIDHELLRNLLLNADVTFRREDFEDLGRQDDVFGARVGGDYLMNRYLKLGFGYRYQDRATPPGTQTGREYKINEIFIRLVGEL